MITRRLFLAGTTFLVGCAGFTPAQAVTDAGIILGDAAAGTGLAGAYAIFKADFPTQVSAAVDTEIQAALTRAKNGLAMAKAVIGQTVEGGAGALSLVLSNASAVMTILTPLAAPSPSLLLALEAAQALWPIAQAEVAALTPGAPTTVPAARAVPSKMSPEQARSILS